MEIHTTSVRHHFWIHLKRVTMIIMHSGNSEKWYNFYSDIKSQGNIITQSLTINLYELLSLSLHSQTTMPTYSHNFVAKMTTCLISYKDLLHKWQFYIFIAAEIKNLVIDEFAAIFHRTSNIIFSFDQVRPLFFSLSHAANTL